jgi:hypothetical protein
MHSPSVDSSDQSSGLLVEIVDALETYGLERGAYQLHDYVDVEALEQTLHSSSENVEVRFTVDGIRLAVTPESVDLVANNISSSRGRDE